MNNPLNLQHWAARVRNPRGVARSVQRKIASSLSHRLFTEYSFLPQEVLFFVTYRCNLRCRMCGQWGEKGYVKKGAPDILQDELKLRDMLPTLDQLARFGPRVFLCGGEIFLFEEWEELLQALQDRGLRTTIITNGTRLEEAAQHILRTGVEQISLSLDGTAASHDKIRGVEGLFQKVENGIRALVRERNAAGQYYPRIVINTTLSQLNFKDLMPFVETMQKHDLDSINVLHFNFLPTTVWRAHERVFQRLFGTDGNPCWGGFVQDPDAIDAPGILRAIREVKERTFRVPVGFFPDYDEAEIREYYGKNTFQAQRFSRPCRGAWNTVNILPNGDMSPCLDVVVGNIRDRGGFRAAWNGDRMRKFRRTLKEKKRFPACTRCCLYYRF